ncbi:phosphatase PAP2 family protein [Gordonia liuliyuniae]|uniref:Phosphatase PAP2 family protein n=1 Tax=Gordonia liuliyuniae TaxID=2911517 RepID=A0ABS9IMT4_9ACTN|nr:phosphatase PAP2 family protein [Gordonia liuliyuniae]MCF8586867.1 phosphatase PAP2 family protein [Gordonia liuliyuniae]
MKPFGVDDTVTDWILSHRGEPWTSFMQFITVWGDTLTLTLVVIGVAVLAWMAGRIDFAAMIVAGSLSGWALMSLLKVIFARDRPPVDDRLIEIGGYSFPSGHSMLSLVVYGLAVIIVHRLYPRVRERAGWLVVGPVLVALIGFSRVYLGVHWLSDVLFGWLFGAIWVTLCVAVHVQSSRRRQAARAARRTGKTQSSPS